MQDVKGFPIIRNTGPEVYLAETGNPPVQCCHVLRYVLRHFILKHHIWHRATIMGRFRKIVRDVPKNTKYEIQGRLGRKRFVLDQNKERFGDGGA